MNNNVSIQHTVKPSPIGFQPSTLSKISHEIRIPLTGILGMAHFLEETPLTVEQKEYLQGILDSANRLLKLEDKLHSILNVS